MINSCPFHYWYFIYYPDPIFLGGSGLSPLFVITVLPAARIIFAKNLSLFSITRVILTKYNTRQVFGILDYFNIINPTCSQYLVNLLQLYKICLWSASTSSQRLWHPCGVEVCLILNVGVIKKNILNFLNEREFVVLGHTSHIWNYFCYFTHFFFQIYCLFSVRPQSLSYSNLFKKVEKLNFSWN